MTSIGLDRPFFSVLMPAYDAEATLEAAVRSVMGQTFGDWELIIADDGSTDSTRELALALSHEDARIVVDSAPHAGMSGAMNRAALRARASWLAWLSADDIFLPRYLEAQKDFMARHPDGTVFSSNGYWKVHLGKFALRMKMRTFSREREYGLAEMIEANRIHGLAVFRRDLYLEAGGLPADLGYAEEWELWLRLLASGRRIFYNPRPLVVYSAGAVDNKSSRRRAVVSDSLSLLARIREEFPGMPKEAASAFPRALERQRKLLAVADLEERMLEGDYSKARRAYLPNAAAFPTFQRRLGGLALMLVSPRLYRRLLLPGRTPADG